MITNFQPGMGVRPDPAASSEDEADPTETAPPPARHIVLAIDAVRTS